jgi:general secretion pathway protein A
MYTSYWNLKSSPFLNADTPALLYPSEQFQEGLARLYYLIDQERIAGMVTGPYGVGKTFLLSNLVGRAEGLRLPIIRFDAIPHGGLPMASHILRRLGVQKEPPALADALMLLQQRATDAANALQRHILLIDEAHYLAEGDGLYLVHFLCNLRLRTPSGEKPLFTIILSGSPELAKQVRNFESLRRRIQLAWELTPLSAPQTTEYVQQHIRAVGGDSWIFTLEALAAIHRLSSGIPRSINNLADTALMLGYASQARSITPDLVEEAAADTGLAPDPVPSTPS